MGRKKEKQPERLAEKVRSIRTRLGLTQPEMCQALIKHGADVRVTYISLFETGTRLPPVLVILAYARAAGISTEMLIDDTLEISLRLPKRKT